MQSINHAHASTGAPSGAARSPVSTGIDEDRLHAFIGQVLNDLGGAYSATLVTLGDRLGLYRTLRDQGPATPAELAARSGCAERYLREWLSHQAASSYLAYDPASGRFALPPEQAMVFANEDSPVYLMGGFEMVGSHVQNQPRVAEAFRSGDGVAWGDQGACMFCAVARFFRPGYEHNLVQSWLPALDGVVGKLERGASVADVGCGHGHSTLVMARAFPNSSFVGFDFHPDSITAANAHRDAEGISPERVRFEVATAKDFPGRYDLVTCFDCLHDMGDPAGAAAHVRAALAEGGSWMIVEPIAGDSLVENLNPVGRLYYAASTMICVPTSLAQETGAALGAQAGERRLAEVIRSGGFGSVRRAAETPFNMVLEARA
ncbi:class I SAM-dependent methyltransferase [Luteimonas sp. RD2P54]|uniref:Class I SAM-dependent methyltransferase n=1 Tax=Luteimonas endophytica TaxID=3042023 RepID=A0ABT6J561_9GAMM|nr:class I SAM-dependent methyltransferase [Luteimonas endophytica]MDH5821958.1 class I SAM-dependent methyltransferase [Luteimonas endophytica]